MGGTFDPVHVGHLILGEKAYEQLNLDQVWFMPSGNPPHKQNREGRATDEQRSVMVEKAIAGNPHFALSLIEMNEEGYSYTCRTLETLRREHPDTDYFFIIGADSLYSFSSWMEPERICRACTLVAAVRNHIPAEELDLQIQKLKDEFHGNILKLDTLNIDISSEILRRWMKEGKSIRYYVPDDVIRYICQNRIYGALPQELRQMP